MVDGYNRLYAGAHAKPDYITRVRGMIGVLRDRYDLGHRKRGLDVAQPELDVAESQQCRLSW